jgi:hypothetical protein
VTVNLANTADGGSNGTTITAGNSGGTSGPPWDNATSNTGSGGVLSYDNTHVLGGHPLAIKIATGGSSITVFTAWTTSLTATSIPQVWFRFYLYITVNPAATIRVFQALNAGTLCAAVNLQTTGALRVVDSAAGTIFTSNVTLTANSWARVEGFVIGDPSAGQVELRIYKTYDAALQNYDYLNTSAASQNTSGTITQARFGIGSNIANGGPYWIASPGASDTAYLGPEAPVSGVPRVLAGPVLLNGPMRYARPRLITPVEPSSVRLLQNALPVSVTTTGTVQDQASKALSTSVATTATTTDQVGKTFTAGPVTATGTLARNPGKSLPASVTTTGTLVRNPGKALGAAVTTTATLGRALARTLTVAVTTTATLARNPARTFTAAVTTASSLAHQAGKTLAAAVTTTATAVRGPGKTFTSAVTTTASLVRSPGKALPASVTATASLGARALAKAFSVTVITGGTLKRTLTRTFTATVATTGTYAKGYFRTFAATVTTAGAIRRGAGKILSAVVTALGSVFNSTVPGPRQPGVLTITPYGAQAAVLTVTPAGAQAAVMTIAPAGASTAVLTVSTPGQRPITWEPGLPLTFPPAMLQQITPAA